MIQKRSGSWQIFKWVAAPLFLFALSILLSIFYFFNSDINPNIRSVDHNSNNIYMDKGIVQGEIIGQDNYLSIVSVRFDNSVPYRGDSIFKIKKISDHDWFHIATISASQYNTIPLYAFGFPTIAKSKKILYKFEIHIQNNSPGWPNLSLSKDSPILISRYQYPKNILLENRLLLVEFMIRKLQYYINTSSSLGVYLVYSIPLIIYLSYILFLNVYFSLERKKILKEKLLLIIKPYFFFIFICIFIDIFILHNSSKSMLLIISILSIFGIYAYRLGSEYVFSIAFLLLSMCPFMLAANMDSVADKSAIWSYIFLVTGTIQTIIELILNKSTKLNAILIFLSDLFSIIVAIDSKLLLYGKKTIIYASSSIRNFLITILFSIIISLAILGVVDIYIKTMNYRNRQSKNPGAPYVEPMLVYPGTKVFLYGDRFGDGVSGKYALMKDGEKIRTDYWEDHKIIFTVPLSWKTGPINLWIEKPVEWNAETVIERTKPIQINLLKVTGYFTKDDDLYFEQLKWWREETKEINGYK